jgi:hypothetical protein
LAELETNKHSGATVIEWPWKYMQRASKAGPPWKYMQRASKAGPGSLYDLERDPGERRDVAASHPGVALRLRRQAERMRAEGLGGLTLACVAGSSREHVSLTLWLGREASALDGLALEPKDDVEPRLDGEGRMTGASLRFVLPPQNFDRGPRRPRDRDGLRVRTQEGGGKGSWVRIDPKGVLSQPPVFGPGNERLVPGRTIPLRSIRSRRVLPSLTHHGPRPVCRLHYYEPPETPRPTVEPALMERLRALGYVE